LLIALPKLAVAVKQNHCGESDFEMSFAKSPLTTQPGHAAVYDYEYVRNGVADLFMCFDRWPPRTCLRKGGFVKVTTTRTKIDFAQCLKALSDTVYPDADTIVLVMDNLNIHSLASLYAAFPPEEARRLLRSLV
jgi:hypothetical protein